MPLLDCFGKGKRNKKEPIVPPPSRESIDRPARTDTESNPPPLPQRTVEHDSPPGQRLSEGHQTEQISLDFPPASPRSLPEANINTNARLVKQLSSEVLATPVPIGLPKSERQEPIGEESGEDYIDPQPKPLPRAAPASPDTSNGRAPSRSKPKASISEEKRSEILSDYFQREDVSMPTPPIVYSDNSDGGESLPDYTNMAELHETPALDNSGKSNTHLGIYSKSTSCESDPEQIKSPRRPRPVPRAPGSGNSSRKHSLTNSDSDDSAFVYENVHAALGEDSKSQTERLSPSAPKPKPRIRSDIKSYDPSLDAHESLFQPVPTQHVNHPQLQQKIAQGYVTEADYVQPSDDLSPVRTSPPNSASLHNLGSGNVDLTARVPTHAPEPGLKAKKHAYLPMDHNPKTIAQRSPIHDHTEQSNSSHGRYNLNTKIPVGNIHDVHVPGYLTVLGDTPKPTLTGAYQNISQQSDYINANIDRPALKSRQHNGALPESPYYG